VGNTISATMVISSAHPSLRGHFPQRPVVPGVVILDHVIDAAYQQLPTPFSVRSVVQTKFLRALLPNEEAIITMELRTSSLHFVVTVGAAVVASGALKVEFGPGP
jgi:3-hydroxyacyl-[acyl-carrier-protein] dehydratase